MLDGGTWPSLTSPRPATCTEVTVGFACMFVFIVILAVQRDDVGAPRRRGGDRRVDVDVRRPSTNASRSRAGAVFWRSPPTDDAGLDGTGEEGMGPTGPSGVFA